MQPQTYDASIERSVLSSIIFDPALLQKYHSSIKASMFFLSTHQNIYTYILTRYNNEQHIDEVLIVNKLGSKYEHDLMQILEANPIHHLDSYLEVLNDYAIKRDINSLLHNVGTDLDSHSGIELQSKIVLLSHNLSNKYSSKIFQIDNINSIQEQQSEFICSSWLPIPKRTVSLITAPGGTGKSWLVLQLAMRAIQSNEASRVFLWLSEDPKELTKHRFNKVFYDILKSTNNNIKDKIDISDSPTIQIIYDEQRKLTVNPLFYQFKSMLDSYDLIILDPLIAFYGSDENNNSNARVFMQLFTEWANKENKTIIFIHHSTKNTTGSRGASAFVDAVRVVYELDKIRDSDGNIVDSNSREIKLTKDNYGAGQFLDSFSFQRVLFPYSVKIETKNISQSLTQIDSNETTLDDILHVDTGVTNILNNDF